MLSPALCQYRARSVNSSAVLTRYQAGCKFPPGTRWKSRIHASIYKRHSTAALVNKEQCLYWIVGTWPGVSAVLAQCRHKHGLPPARLRVSTWLEIVHRYWRDTGHRYQPSTEIYTGSVLALLRSRLLADNCSQNWGLLCQYHANPRPGINSPVQALLLVYNWRGTVPFVNTGMNPTFRHEQFRLKKFCGYSKNCNVSSFRIMMFNKFKWYFVFQLCTFRDILIL